MNELIYYDLKQSPGLSHSLSGQVAREIGRRIVAGHYAPETLIEDEASLAARFGVSRSVVRDAVKILVGKGLVSARRGIGTTVSPRSGWGLLDDDVLAWHQSAPASAEFLIQLTDFRLVIEPKAARWAAERATEADCDEIRTALRRMADYADGGTSDDFIAADALFHRSILRAAHNDFLAATEGVIFAALLDSIRLTNRHADENALSLPFHVAVADAIFAHRADAAERAMTTLLADARARLERRSQNSQNTNSRNANNQHTPSSTEVSA